MTDKLQLSIFKTLKKLISTKIPKIIIVRKMTITLIIQILFLKINIVVKVVTAWEQTNNIFSIFNVLTAFIKVSSHQKNLGIKTNFRGEHRNRRISKVLTWKETLMLS